MQIAAKYKYAKISPQKVRLVADQVRGLTAEKAVTLLIFSNKKAASKSLLHNTKPKKIISQVETEEQSSVCRN